MSKQETLPITSSDVEFLERINDTLTHIHVQIIDFRGPSHSLEVVMDDIRDFIDMRGSKEESPQCAPDEGGLIEKANNLLAASLESAIADLKARRYSEVDIASFEESLQTWTEAQTRHLAVNNMAGDSAYQPWREQGISEAEYFKRRYIEARREVGALENENQILIDAANELDRENERLESDLHPEYGLPRKIAELETENARLKAEVDSWIAARDKTSVLLWERIMRAEKERDALKEERDRVASGKVSCADCGAILARW